MKVIIIDENNHICLYIILTLLCKNSPNLSSSQLDCQMVILLQTRQSKIDFNLLKSVVLVILTPILIFLEFCFWDSKYVK